MAYKLSLIGLGEAAQTFARAAHWGKQVCAYDIAPVTYDGLNCCASNTEAVADANIILSLVTADQSVDAAKQTALSLKAGALYCDMNSVSPGSKKAAAHIIDGAGGRYVDVAVMAPVHPIGMAVPLLVSGPHAQAGIEALQAIGFSNVAKAGEAIGQASAIKMIRSVMVKGIEALTAEMMLAARSAGVEAAVLASLGDNWPEKAAYNLERMATHGLRRAAEMEESARTLEHLGIDPVMTRGTIVLQREMAGKTIL